MLDLVCSGGKKDKVYAREGTEDKTDSIVTTARILCTALVSTSKKGY